MIRFIQERGGKMHVMGLCSDVGVHSRLDHLYGLLKLARRNDLDAVYIHAFTDGRDSPPESGKGYLAQIEAKAAEIGIGTIASVAGRFYAMDRDSRWERVQKAYDCLRSGKGHKVRSAEQAITESYGRQITDEFVEPTCIVDNDGQPLATIDDGDGVVFFNFRGDRPRELTRAFVDPAFDGFERVMKPDLYYVCMTEYDTTIPAPVAFPKPPKMKNILGVYLSELGLTQFRCAETEKYAHVTFFFNDYTEAPFKGEDRQIVPSPRVRTYDLKPEMSAYEVTDKLVEAIKSRRYDAIICNFANGDMVGHTGKLAAATRAIEVLDECIGRTVAAMQEIGGEVLITADHGNAETMLDTTTHQAHTAHTLNVVPLLYIGRKAKIASGGALQDVAPTLLAMMGLPQPPEMTGKPLVTLQ